MRVITTYVARQRQNYMHIALLSKARCVQRLENQTTRIARLPQFFNEHSAIRIRH